MRSYYTRGTMQSFASNTSVDSYITSRTRGQSAQYGKVGTTRTSEPRLSRVRYLDRLCRTIGPTSQTAAPTVLGPPIAKPRIAKRVRRSSGGRRCAASPRWSRGGRWLTNFPLPIARPTLVDTGECRPRGRAVHSGEFDGTDWIGSTSGVSPSPRNAEQ